MRWWHHFRALVRNLVFRSRVDRDLRDELQSYVQLSADERLASGVAREDAERDAGSRSWFGDRRWAVRAHRAGVAIEQAWQDACRSVRALRRAPGRRGARHPDDRARRGRQHGDVLGGGRRDAEAAAVRHPEQLVEIATVANLSANQRALQIGMRWSSLDRWRAEKELVSTIVTFQGPSHVTVEGAPISGPTQVSRISPELPAELGLAPIIGRMFNAEDARSDASVLLAEPFWRTAFQASPSVLGTTITLDRRPYRIVGVMPATLHWRVGTGRVVAWLPFDEARARADRAKVPFVDAIARLRPGLSVEQASRDLPGIVDRLQPGVAKARRWEVQLVPLDTRGMSTGTTRQGLAVLFGAVGLVLLTTCANVANLLLARALTRQREVGIAAALGATRARLVRQLFIEGAVLALAGGLVALVLLRWTAGLLPVVIPDQLGLFAANPLAFDARTVVYGALIVLVAAVVASALPALRASRPDLTQIIGSSVRVAGATPSGRRWRVVLQVAQVAVAFVLLTGAALLTTSVVRMIATPAGYDIDRLATVNLALPEPRVHVRLRIQRVLRRVSVARAGISGPDGRVWSPTVRLVHRTARGVRTGERPPCRRADLRGGSGLFPCGRHSPERGQGAGVRRHGDESSCRRHRCPRGRTDVARTVRDRSAISLQPVHTVLGDRRRRGVLHQDEELLAGGRIGAGVCAGGAGRTVAVPSVARPQ